MFIVASLLNPSLHRKRHIGKQELMSLLVFDVADMSSVLMLLKILNQFGDV